MKNIKLKQLINLKNIEIINIDKLKNHPLNPRRQTEEGMELLRKSVKQLGTFRPFIINNKNEILAGNQLLKVLKEEGYKEASCILPNAELTEEQEKQIIAMDNQNSFHKSSNQFDADIVANHFNYVLEEFELQPEEIDYTLSTEYIERQNEIENLTNDYDALKKQYDEIIKDETQDWESDLHKKFNKIPDYDENAVARGKIIIECNQIDKQELLDFLQVKCKEISIDNIIIK